VAIPKKETRSKRKKPFIAARLSEGEECVRVSDSMQLSSRTQSQWKLLQNGAALKRNDHRSSINQNITYDPPNNTQNLKVCDAIRSRPIDSDGDFDHFHTIIDGMAMISEVQF
jgi:hypothetical protein